MKGYIYGTLGQQGRAQKPTLKASDLAGGTQEEDNEFLEAEHCPMIFEGS
jgi:hypothetical protein